MPARRSCLCGRMPFCGYALMAVDADGTHTPATGTATIHVGGFSPGGAAATTEMVSGTVALR